jgi:Phage tail baseplate hub (GPD)
MLDSLFGIRLILLIGPTIPLPPSADVMNALSRVEVTNDSSTADGFQLTFACGRSGLADYDLIQDGTFDPMTRVIVGVIFGVLPEVLIDGVITHSQFNPGTAPGQATLTVTGKDLTAAMDLEEKNKSYENQPDFVIVTTVLASYAKYGITPMPTPTADVPIMLERIPRQQETDLKFIQRLAQRNGFVFYLEPLTIGVNMAYWGPEKRVGLPQPALSVNLGASTNVKSLSFANDALAATGTRGVIVEPFTKIRIPIPALPSLKIPPLVSTPATPYRTTLQRDSANQNPATAATRMLAAATNTPDSATADGEADGVRYGTALRARKLVGVRGVGLTHGGFWYVRRVTHAIGRGDYSQRFSLSREGTGTLTPVLRP